MFDNVFFYLFIVFLFFGIGDYLGVITKAKVSAVFVSLLLFLVSFMTGLIPPDTIARAELSGVGKWGTAFIVFHMGTMINLKQLADEWRTVATAVLSMIAVAVAGFAMMPFIGYAETVVAIPVINGGIVATQIMTAAAMEQGLSLAAALGTITFAVQKFVGTPIASYFGLKEARYLVAEYRRTGVNPVRRTDSETAKKVTFAEQNKRFFGPFACLAITGFFGWLAFVIGKYTGVSYTIWCLLLGTLLAHKGWIPERIMEKAGAQGFFNAAVFAAIIPALARIRPQDLLTLSYALIILFAVALAVLYICFYLLPLWRLAGSKNLAMGISVTQMMGFPATYLVALEIAQAAAETEEERKLVMDVIMPKYLVGGLSTVTSLSVIMAGILETLL